MENKHRIYPPRGGKTLGFTLSEVLITLVIIGIIAGLTVPVLIQHHKRIETAAKLKKFYSALAQAIKLAEIEYGIPSKQFYTGQYSLELWNKYIQKYLPIGERIDIVDDRSGYIYPFNDGTGLTEIGSDLCSGQRGNGYEIDINGEKGPNEPGRDRFAFCIFREKYINENPELKPLSPANYGASIKLSKTREEYLDDCKKYPTNCTALIMNDGWEIKSDYPYRL